MKRNTFFTSDAHIGHDNILQFTNRKFDNIQDMNYEIIRRWNSVVKENDVVYILGDHIWNTVKSKAYKEFNNKLNGQKILIIGNHDKVTEIQALNLGFRYACREATIRIAGQYVKLSHYPYRYGFWKELRQRLKVFFSFKKYKPSHRGKRPRNDGAWLLHGHTHSESKTHPEYKYMYHVGMDAHNLYPVSAGQIVEWMRSVKKSNKKK